MARELQELEAPQGPALDITCAPCCTKQPHLVFLNSDVRSVSQKGTSKLESCSQERLKEEAARREQERCIPRSTGTSFASYTRDGSCANMKSLLDFLRLLLCLSLQTAWKPGMTLPGL